MGNTFCLFDVYNLYANIGDPYSSTIFLIIFNPLIQYIKMNSEKYGYKLNDKYINTTPFADDFNIISRNKIQHQKFITDIEQKTETMGLIFKPSKCRSHSIQSGKPSNVTFVLNDDKNLQAPIETLQENSHKFLGSVVTFSNKPQEYFELFILSLKTNLRTLINQKSEVNSS